MTGPRVQGPDSFSVPVVVQVPNDLHGLLTAGARRHGVTVSALLVELVRRGLVNAPRPQKKPQRKVRVVKVKAPPRQLWAAEHDAEVRRLHAEGLSDTEIAKVLPFNQGTVSRHREALGLAPLFVGRPKKVRP